jgi:hypothetical protein
MQRLCNLGAAAGGIGFFFLHEEVKRMLQGRELHPLDEIQEILEHAKAEYEASTEQPPINNEVKEGESDYRAFVLEKNRESYSDNNDDEVCKDSGASIHIERKRASTSRWVKPNHDSATKVTGIDQVPLRVTHSGVVPGFGKVFVVPECGSDICSVAQLTDYEWKVLFSQNEVQIFHPTRETVYGYRNEINHYVVSKADWKRLQEPIYKAYLGTAEIPLSTEQ